MDSTLQDKLQELMTHLTAEETRLQQELEVVRKIREPIQQSLQEVKELSLSTSNNGRLAEATKIASRLSDQDTAPAPPQDRGASELPKGVTRRQVIHRIIPGFHGKRFKSGDVRHRFVEDYLGGVEPPNFAQAINNLLKRMSEKGEIQDLGRDESEPGAPRYYLEIESQEENLLEP